MKRKKRNPLKWMGFLSAAAGILIAFSFMPVYEFTLYMVREYLNAGPYSEITVKVMLGIFYFAVLIYMSSMIMLNEFTRNFYNDLLKEFRKKELLPGGYKILKGSKIKKRYTGIMDVMDIFIKKFFEVKKEKEKFSKIIATHLDPSLRRELEDRGINEIYIGSRKKTAAIFFSDIRGFTSFTETNKPENVEKVLNDYFTFTTDIINKNGGRVNKYIGDAVLAVFEGAAKYKESNESDKAVIASLDIQTQWGMYIKKWKETIDPDIKIGLGIGIAWGEIITGNMGSEERIEYTVIGDAVNFASRLCSKALDGQIIIPDSVYFKVKEFVDVEPLPPVEVKGKQGVFDIYHVKTRRMLA
ncbi:MAG: adenylate/guanylate cyclase domain-containing protein [bacterium]